MNHAEEATFWYLRLNGFFPITNFVIHASRDIVHTSDCDVLAVRLPFVYEEIGGREDDWDSFLCRNLNLSRPIGIICEVKSGRYDAKQLFRTEALHYAIARLGFIHVNEVRAVADALGDCAVVTLPDGVQIAKLLVARQEGHGAFLMRQLDEVEDFLRIRVEKYPKQKYADRMFFGPVLFQTVIELTAGRRKE